MVLDESIIHLFNPEELKISHQLNSIHKEYSNMSTQLKKIGSRYNEVFKIYKPIKTKYLKKVRDDKRKKILKEKAEKERLSDLKRKEFDDIKNKFIEQKKLNFTDNLSKFEISFYELFKEKVLIRMNFENEKDIDRKIIEFSKTFREHCVHPECCKTTFIFEDWEECAGGQSTQSCNRILSGCVLCYTQTDTFSQYSLSEKFSQDKTRISHENYHDYINESIYLKEILSKKHL